MEDKPPLKMYCIVSREALKAMNGNRGKFGTQCGHAYVHALLNGQEEYPDRVKAYLNDQRAFKITLAVDTSAELLELFQQFNTRCGIALIEDIGLTVFKEPTVTCLGLGPLPPYLYETINHLKPLI